MPGMLYFVLQMYQINYNIQVHEYCRFVPLRSIERVSLASWLTVWKVRIESPFIGEWKKNALVVKSRIFYQFRQAIVINVFAVNEYVLKTRQKSLKEMEIY